MAPLSPSVAYATHELIPRGLGTHNMTADNALTTSQSNTLQILALVFATISISSAILAFYWFVKMRRSFRHEYVSIRSGGKC
jgi:G protein-coupled receptor GPR1